MTSNTEFKYLWRAVFDDICVDQDPLDRYSKHNPDSDYNPSSFRDFQDKLDEGHKLRMFSLVGDNDVYVVELNYGKPTIKHISYTKTGRATSEEILCAQKEPMDDVRIIYFRQMEQTVENGTAQKPKILAYVLGFQGCVNGENVQKTITVL